MRLSRQEAIECIILLAAYASAFGLIYYGLYRMLG
jgi:hypothetical protein